MSILEDAFTRVLDTLTYQIAYIRGYAKPNYPVPAIMLRPAFETEDGKTPSALVIYEFRLPCECCGGWTRTVACTWDFKFDRCMDFGFPFGCYTNRREIQEGIEFYKTFMKAGTVGHG